MISNFDWSTLIDDIWIRVLRAFYPDDLTSIARLMCTCRSLQRAGKTLLSTAETCDKKRSNGDRDNVVIAWLMKHSPKLSILKTPVLSKELRIPPTLTTVMRNLTQLHLHSAILKHHHLKSLFQNEKSCQIRFPNLTHLTLKSCKFEGSGNEKWLNSLAFPNLTSLDLSWCMNLTPKMVADVVFKLDSVSFHGCCDIDNFIIPRLYNVEKLDLAFASISDEGLGILAAACLSLRTLILADPTASNNWVYGSWTEPGLTKFKQRRPNVDVKLVNL